MDVAQIERVTATGDVTTETSYLHSVTLLGGSAASTLTVRADGATGAILLTVKAAIDTTVSVPLGAAGACPGGIHATLAGAGAEATFVFA